MKGSQAQSAIHSRQTGLHNIFAIREARGGQSRSDDRNGMLSPNLPLIAGTMNDDNCEGFRALAYESLQCRNPRATHARLWVNRLWDGSGG